MAIHGQGFASRAVTENLAAAYPVADPALFHVGLLHTSLNGREGHATYAPTSSEVLTQKGYQYWALGHVHKREVVSKDPWIVFPGNLQGRNAREVGPKGCTLVTVEDGAISHIEERHVDVLRWSVCRVDVNDVTTTNDMLDRVSRALTADANHVEGRVLAARVAVIGRAACHDEIAANTDHWIEEIRALAVGVLPPMFGSSGCGLRRIGRSTCRRWLLVTMRSAAFYENSRLLQTARTRWPR